MASWGSCSQAPPATPQDPSCYTEQGYPIYNRSQAGWGEVTPSRHQTRGSTMLCICDSQIRKSPFCSDPAALAVFLPSMLPLLPRVRAHRDLLNVLFCLILRRIPCCKASCQYSLCWDCSFRPNTTLSSGRPTWGL